jgi:putative hydrolase of the HAD superfamily
MNFVFDFGAVLFTWEPARLVHTALREHAPTPAAAKLLAHAIFGHEDWHGFDRGTVSFEDVLRRTTERVGVPALALDALLAPIGERLTPIAESVQLLGALRERREQRGDIRLYYLSNMPEPYARVLEQRHDFLQWFDGGIFSGDVKMAKPEPAIFKLLAERHGLEPARTVFIDDMAGNVEAARGLGWQGIHFVSPQEGIQQILALLPDASGKSAEDTRRNL